MALPQLDANGRLPAGRHRATVQDIVERFVVEAPHSQLRAETFRGLLVYLNRLVRLTGPGVVWIDGGFVTHKQPPPHDVDLTFLCRDEAHLEALLKTEGILELITLQDVAYWRPWPGVARRLQPVGGHVDAFLIEPSTHAFWDRLWSNVKEEPGQIKGYVELEVRPW